MMQEMHRILGKYQSANVVEPNNEKRECNQKIDSMILGMKTLEKAVEIKEKEIGTNQMPKEVKTDESKSWFIEQEIKPLDSGLKLAKVRIPERLIGAVIGPGNNVNFFVKQ